MPHHAVRTASTLARRGDAHSGRTRQVVRITCLRRVREESEARSASHGGVKRLIPAFSSVTRAGARRARQRARSVTFRPARSPAPGAISPVTDEARAPCPAAPLPFRWLRHRRGGCSRPAGAAPCSGRWRASEGTAVPVRGAGGAYEELVVMGGPPPPGDGGRPRRVTGRAGRAAGARNANGAPLGRRRRHAKPGLPCVHLVSAGQALCPDSAASRGWSRVGTPGWHDQNF